MALQVTVDVRLVPTHALTNILWWNATFVFDVALKTVFPFVISATCLALPRLGIVLMLKHNLILLSHAGGAGTVGWKRRIRSYTGVTTVQCNDRCLYRSLTRR